MGKKGSWFSAIKRAFSPHYKEKLSNQEPERKSGKEKSKKRFGKLRHGETSSFLPVFREPSSIEKILIEAEIDHNLVFKPPTITPDRTNPSSASPPPPARPPPPIRSDVTRVTSQRTSPPIVPSPRPISPRVASPRAVPPCLDTPRQPSPRTEPPRLDAPRLTLPKPPSPRAVSPRPEPTLLVQHASATKIQSAFRGSKARKSFKALKGLVRLQRVVKGYNVKRQTINAMKYMQQLVRVQSQIQSRRIKMLQNQSQVDKDDTRRPETEAVNDNWDDSVLTKEERDARSQRKIDAIVKRERSMAYAHSHKDIGSSGGLTLWWNWMDWKLPVPSHSQPLRDHRLTPTRLISSPLSQPNNQKHFRLDNNFDTPTPGSLKSTLLTPSKPIRTSTSRHSRGRFRGHEDSPFKDDDSLTSCPPFPSYMAPTVSAKAKVRPNSNPKERVMVTTSSESSENRRMSYPPTQQGLDMFRWNKGSLLMSSSHRGHGSLGGVVLEKHKTLKSVGDLSIGSAVSMPATVGRKQFNRYV